MKMLECPNLEIHASYACNLFCKSCSHFSDHGIGIANVPLEELADQMGQWSGRIQPKNFSILGGEPALNKELVAIVRECRKQWPASDLLLVSNGFFLKNHPNLPKALEQTNCRLDISVHHDGEEYTEKLQPVREMLDSWKAKHNFRLNYRPSAPKWRTTFEGYGSGMVPWHDENPEASYNVCVSKHCPQIFEGKIFKCPQLAYLRLMDKKFDLIEEWEKYLSYRPLYPSCSEEELHYFFKTKAEPACAMCPAHQRLFQIPNPLRKSN